MKIDKNIMELIFELEYIIGNRCYNPHSYDGYSREQGKQFRYPVWADGRKFYGVIAGVPPEKIGSIEYKLGANELMIGSALKRILEFLEERYDIDFNQLEKNRKKK